MPEPGRERCGERFGGVEPFWGVEVGDAELATACAGNDEVRAAVCNTGR